MSAPNPIDLRVIGSRVWDMRIDGAAIATVATTQHQILAYLREKCIGFFDMPYDAQHERGREIARQILDLTGGES